ncbi:hypothetical protein SmJEL517_g02464 [Synchytrium microbalum]|uniref:G-protein coupled receptors family 1 profile domain-containing protein n=1 Tax=Synchytrium microbalum TaxID=1806994 RepID=A0A507CBT8_9FUNG|nr:uncharacterized protein SmJEL517_g02464 [Synchytrium microbalum]TPX35013.1 hypothetical protein SmJEL517_g02464 [Synchytrium microbalum]
MLPHDIVILNLVGDILSLVGGFLILTTLLLLSVWRRESIRDDLRSLIILSLITADTANSLVNLITGITVLHGNKLDNGMFCTVTGFIGQATVQSSDFCVVLMALVSYATFNPNGSRILAWVQSKPWVLILPIAIIPLVTATIALIPGYEKASFSWCWISTTPVYARYTLSHGLRIGIMITLPFLYGAIYLRIRLAYQDARERSLARQAIEAEWDADITPTKSSQDTDIYVDEWSDSDTIITLHRQGSASKMHRRNTASDRGSSIEINKVTQLRHAMRLMIVFPVIYFVLWIPGIVDRLYVAITGNTTLLLEALQCATQFIGLFNAILYGLNPNVRSGLKQFWAEFWHESDNVFRE